jgi:hypothetical protein
MPLPLLDSHCFPTFRNNNCNWLSELTGFSFHDPFRMPSGYRTIDGLHANAILNLSALE